MDVFTGKKRKAQLVFEFVVAVVLFIAIVLHIINILNINVSSTAESMMKDDLEYRAMQIADLLVRSKGSSNSIGLASSRGWPYLNEAKLNNFRNECNKPNNLNSVYKKFDLKDREKARVFINTTFDEWECGPDAPNITKGYAKRYALYDTTASVVTTIEVWVWKT